MTDPDPNAPPTPAWLLFLARRRGIDDTRAQAAFDHRVHVDRFGDRIHLALALLFCFFLAWPISYMEIAFAPLIVCTVIRVWFIRRCIGLLFLQTPFVLIFLFWLWAGAGIAWAPDLPAAIKEWGAMRYAFAMIALFPLIRYRAALTIAIAAGFLCANASQLANALGVHFQIPWLILRDFTQSGRNAGWWPEVIGGELLVGALGLHLPRALLSGATWSWSRAAAIGAALITLVGIAATGTRAAWIGAAVLLGIALITGIVRLPTRRARITVAILAVAALLTLGSVVGLLLGDTLSRRYTDARNEIARMVDRGEYQTNNGMRIQMALWAWQAFKEHPLTGLGSGGYREYVIARKAAATGNELAAVELFERDGHGHCHNAVLQLLAITGLPGAMLFIGGVGSALYGAFVLLRPRERGTYAEGPVWGLLGILLIAPFDVIHVSIQPAALVYVLLALCPVWRPADGHR